MLAVVGRSVVTGAVAGVAAGLLVLPALALYGLFDDAAPLTGGPGPDAGSLIGGLVVLAVYGTVVGAPAGAVFGLVAGVLLGALRPRLTGRAARCRVAGLAVCGGLVGGYSVVLVALGVSAVWWVVLCASELVVALVAGWWRGPHLVDGRAAYPYP